MENLAYDERAWEQTDIRLVDRVNTDDYATSGPFENIIGQSDCMQEVFRLIETVADSDSTIIIQGETGTGKGLIAKAIHDNSYRRSKPFVQINCGAIPENLLESELFGHVKGAFTGAVVSKPGKFEVANGGTIFLDEIGDMSPDLQVKLLRVLEENEFERVGGCSTIKTNVRIVAATHRNLEEAVEQGRFREDLFYRLYVIPVHLGPLRERKTDIPLLANGFLAALNQKKNTRVTGFSEKTMQHLMMHSWPGNVRELKNLVERLVVLTREGEIYPKDLPAKMRIQTEPAEDMPVTSLPENGICLTTAVNEFEKALITQSLQKTNGIKKSAARLLNIKRTTLVEKIKRHHLEYVENP
ncbi:MAG: sigma-54 interaction domain-containing protein [Desulfatirhabdiaceae bacterium]